MTAVAIEIRIPQLGESVSEAVITQWLKQDGEHVNADEPVLELETEKAAMEVHAETSGRLSIVEPAGARVRVGTVVGRIAEKAAAPDARPTEGAVAATASRETTLASREPVEAPREPAQAMAAAVGSTAPATTAPASRPVTSAKPLPEPAAPSRPPRQPDDPHPGSGGANGHDDVERVRMSELRRTIATRLVQAQQTAAILTTFNEVDLGDLLAVRARHRERFRAKHGVDLGLMSLFARATALALREAPVLNARIDGSEIVYHRRVHLGIAVSTPRGLVVPVVRNADAMTLAELERAVGERAGRARDGRLTPDDLAGGTFTITNGGVFGSLLSTPLLNPPQSGILGMHTIQDRPAAVGGQVVIRPMMYVALSYDHRLVDGAEAVKFLVRVKEQLEDPTRMLLEV
jgi:2-oxoglutarate dehydrogenase E2 component (dihydrolipoamide succinyltransferase)